MPSEQTEGAPPEQTAGLSERLKKLQRFSFTRPESWSPTAMAGMTEDRRGMWVRHRDVRRLIDTYEKALEEARVSLEAADELARILSETSTETGPLPNAEAIDFIERIEAARDAYRATRKGGTTDAWHRGAGRMAH